MSKRKLHERIYQYLVFLMDDEKTKVIHDFLIHSEIFEEDDYTSSWKGAQNLTIVTNPEIFKKYKNILHEIEAAISDNIYKFSQTIITRVTTFPDLRKFQILENRYSPVVTPWEEVNKNQNILLEQLRTATETIHFQNIGNTGRTIMQLISNIVFDPAIHVAPPEIKLSEGNFKNRLHTFIKIELGGSENKEIREYVLSVITSAEKSIDIANKLTHSLGADLIIAESCVISTISAINMIRLIFNIKKKGA